MEIREDNNTIKLKKDVVKNIAIVFLAIMLILTFFSNSIMNKSLPEVATQYVQSGTITEKIRGTGIVEADDPYSVIVQETRKIESVAVKVGDEVEKDQPLFYLEDSDSTELEEAERALEDLILKYTAGALTGEMSDGAYKNATAGRVLGMNTYEAQIEAAKNRVKAAEELVASITRQQTVADGAIDAGGSEAEIAQAKLELEKLQQEAAVAEENYNKAKESVEAGDAELNLAKEQNDLAQQMLSTAETNYQERLLDIYKKMKEADPTAIDSIFDFYGDKTLRGVKDESLLDTWVTDKYSTPEDRAKYFDEKEAIAKAKSEVDVKAEAYKKAQEKAEERILANQKALAAAESARSEAKKKVANQEIWITTLTNNATLDAASSEVARKQLANDLALKKADAELELSKAKEAQSQLLTDISKTLDLTNQNSIIRDQQEKVAKLREKATGAVITSPVTGTILTVTKTAGESTAAAEALATIQVTGKPMTMNFAVTAEQAKKVKIGDQATLQNAWYYSDNTKITLTKIANDPNNPGRSKLLMFNVEGEVSNGESLSVSLGQRSREFQLVVPNSAVREDNRGKFIYIIEEKGTPFGNRYKAKRIDVEVVASDDNNTAIEANMDAWVYVITTSNKPIESGQQVRLSDR